MKKILSIALVVVLLAGIAVSGTMAYLTDTDSAVNVMTLGNVKIEQSEYERVVGENGDFVTFLYTSCEKKIGKSVCFYIKISPGYLTSVFFRLCAGLNEVVFAPGNAFVRLLFRINFY